MNGMSLPARTFTRIIIVPVLAFGFSLFLHGHISYSAGFAGGVIIALGLMLVMLAFGKNELVKRLAPPRAAAAAGIFLAFFLLLGMLGIVYGGSFLSGFLGTGRHYELFSSGVILFSNIALCLVVAGSLLALLFSLASYRK